MARGSPLCLLHVPKSAGMSVHAALEAAFPCGAIAPRRLDTSVFCDFSDFDALRPDIRATVAVSEDEIQELHRYRVVSGHFSLMNLRRVAVPSAIATVLREPHARLLSLYAYWRSTNQEDWHPYAAPVHAQRPLAEFLSEPLLAPAVDNQVCRLLMPDDPRVPRHGFIASRHVGPLAADAIHRLDELGFVGVLERPDEMWAGLSNMFGVELSRPRVNQTDARESPVGPDGILATERELLERRSAVDTELYRHVSERRRRGLWSRRRAFPRSWRSGRARI